MLRRRAVEAATCALLPAKTLCKYDSGARRDVKSAQLSGKVSGLLRLVGGRDGREDGDGLLSNPPARQTPVCFFK